MNRMTPLEAKYAEALGFYADPEIYMAIGFLPDKPCGEFIDDFSDDHGSEIAYGLRPGKRAREALFGKGEESEVGKCILGLESQIGRLEACGAAAIAALRACLANPLLTPAQSAVAKEALEKMFGEQERWWGGPGPDPEKKP